MRGVRVEEFGGPDVADVRTVADAVPGKGEILVRVRASAVQPVDLKTRIGALHESGLHRGAPVSLGWDVSGVVEAVGAGVRRLRPGHRVIGISDCLDAPSKAHADFVILDEGAAIAVASDLPPEVLAMLPLNGLTAVQALEAVGLARGQSLLVTGAAGAVGSLAVQLALLDGLDVLGAGRSGQRGHIEELGAHFVDATDIAVLARERVPGGVDAAIDCAHLGIATLGAVRNNGALVSLMVGERPPPLRGITSTSIAVCADWKQLTVLAGLADSGVLKLPTPERVALDDAAHAYERVESGAARYIALVP